MQGMTKKELSTLAGYTYRRLFDIDNSLPSDKKLFVESEEGKYDPVMFVKRWVDYNVAHEMPEDYDLGVAKTKHELVKMQKTELEVAKMRGELIDVNDVRRLWGDIVSSAVQNLLALPKKLAPMLVMTEKAEMIAYIIDDELRKVLENISDTPLPDYAADASTDSDEEDPE